MNAKEKLLAKSKASFAGQLANTERESLAELPIPATVSQVEKPMSRTIRALPSLFDKLHTAQLELTLHRKMALSHTDIANEMIIDFIAKVERETGKLL